MSSDGVPDMVTLPLTLKFSSMFIPVDVSDLIGPASVNPSLIKRLEESADDIDSTTLSLLCEQLVSRHKYNSVQ